MFILKTSRLQKFKNVFLFLHEKYSVVGLEWEIEGNIWSHDYTISKNGKVIATIHKKWLTWADTYELCISDNVDHVVALAVIIAIDCVAGDKN